jgi:hypothetical protein
MLDTDDEPDQSEPESDLPSNQNDNENDPQQLLLDAFRSRIPIWGGVINYKNKNNVTLTNTCTIDYYLLALWLLSKIQPNFIEMLPNVGITTHIRYIIDCIQAKNWNKAKETWIVEVMKLSENSTRNRLSLWGSERGRFYKFISVYQRHTLVRVCLLGCSLNNMPLRNNEIDIYLIKRNGNPCEIYSIFDEGLCNLCNAPFSTSIRFDHNPNFIMLQTAYTNVFIQDLPRDLSINNMNFRLLCATVAKPGHFVGLFEFENSLYSVDDMRKEGKEQIELLPRYENQDRRRTRGTENEFYFYESVNISFAMYYLV